jgi:hypothetical protein
LKSAALLVQNPNAARSGFGDKIRTRSVEMADQMNAIRGFNSPLA